MRLTLTATEPSCVAESGASVFWKQPMPVRAALAITTSFKPETVLKPRQATDADSCRHTDTGGGGHHLIQTGDRAETAAGHRRRQLPTYRHRAAITAGAYRFNTKKKLTAINPRPVGGGGQPSCGFSQIAPGVLGISL